MTMELVAELLKLTAIAGLTIAAILTILIWKKGRTTKVTYIKFVIQVLAVVGTFYLFSYPIRPIYIAAVILIMPIVLGRFFCGWICPYGLYMDVITVLRKATNIRYRIIPDRLNKMLHNLRYVLIISFLILGAVFSIMDPPSTGNVLTMMMMHFAGPFEHIGILLSPLTPIIVPWTGPLEIAGIYFSYPYIQEVIKYTGENFATVSALVFLALTVGASFFVRRFWCRFCPTGASIAVLNKIKGFKWAPMLHLDKNEEKCTKCGICKRVCPVQVTEVYEKKGGKIMTSMCMLCARCVEMCPYDNCLKIKFGNKTVLKSRNWLEPSELE
ncbi:MAG: 4Fe-4S binding protein [Candidatus Bathyarchaeota archaeon]|nr:4Fe-4S binding protein [Candidatus Bathyarchaeum tardum]WGM90224.1 MAG: 4Fe-4S binding protein [Candidatus Bathyarchaeum tardum]WNZ29690.1 MAG: 4Fe-4S binding protein [Candidatus Bathyarchaeota archaeon]